ncbi:Hypothetical protein SCF082_LOCUS22518 [Durusdinium trenchii]|uniref:Uncharacterized protein n=1 Tax=Durusdinium trenchii TaxID=1381693 RepID=A0ABP0LGB3_9DINO
MAYYMDEQLLVDTGMINCVIISCASAKTALALAFCLRMRDMRYVFGLTSKDHLDFARSTDLFHEVFSYDNVASLPNNHTVVYMDFKCDGELRQQITLRMGTNLMYNMVVGPAVFQKKMKDQLFEKRAREVLFDESSWRERRRLVAEVTKTGRNEKLKYSYQAFIERMKKIITVKHINGVDGFVEMYDALYSNAAELHCNGTLWRPDSVSEQRNLVKRLNWRCFCRCVRCKSQTEDLVGKRQDLPVAKGK